MCVGVFLSVLQVELSSGEAALAGDLEPVQVSVFMQDRRLQHGTAATRRCVLPWAEVSPQIPPPPGLRSDHTAGGVDLKPGMKEARFPPIFGWIFC